MPTRTTTHDARPTLPVARSAGGADAAPRTHARERPRQCHVWAPALCALRARSRPHVARAPRATHRHAARGARVRAVLELRPPLRDGRAAHMSRAAYLVSNTAPIDLLFVDTDPHGALQTTGWLNPWVARFARAAAWHDSLTTPVGAALVTWLAHHPEWSGAELGTNHGMYLMWRHTP